MRSTASNGVSGFRNRGETRVNNSLGGGTVTPACLGEERIIGLRWQVRPELTVGGAQAKSVVKLSSALSRERYFLGPRLMALAGQASRLSVIFTFGSVGE